MKLVISNICDYRVENSEHDCAMLSTYIKVRHFGKIMRRQTHQQYELGIFSAPAAFIDPVADHLRSQIRQEIYGPGVLIIGLGDTWFSNIRVSQSEPR